VQSAFTTLSLGTALRPRLARTWRNCQQGGQDMYEDWTAGVWWYGSGETLRAEGAEPDWLVFAP
jgi:hypothetical protein